MALRFSIVVATLNRRDMLLSALDSIRAQNWPDVEIIVVDGCSTDGTVEAIEHQEDIILLRGPDAGVYDAFNKGIAAASGDIIGILNSDDLYEPGSFEAVADVLAENPDADAVCGSAVLESNGRIVASFDNDRDKILESPHTTLSGSCILNARFFRRTAIVRNGPFDLFYKLVSDRDWLTRFYEARMRTVQISNLVYRYRQHSDSLTFDLAGKKRSAIYAELVALAHRWRTTESASNETRHVAMLLEGRCRAQLALIALRHARFGEAWRLLFISGARFSFTPLASILNAAVDHVGIKHGGR